MIYSSWLDHFFLTQPARYFQEIVASLEALQQQMFIRYSPWEIHKFVIQLPHVGHHKPRIGSIQIDKPLIKVGIYDKISCLYNSKTHSKVFIYNIADANGRSDFHKIRCQAPV